MVETALLFPLLLLLTIGSADLGRVFYYSVGVTNAAREGARQGIYYDPGTNSNPYDAETPILNAVKAEIPGDVTVTEPAPPGSPADCPTAPYSYPSALNAAFVFICFNENYLATTAAPGQTIRVTVLYNFAPATPLTNVVGSGTIHVLANAVMVVQGAS